MILFCSALKPVYNNIENFSSYLAGLIEGDGSIKVPKTSFSIKGKALYPSISITFVKKDISTAEWLQKNLGGKIYTYPEYVILSFQDLKSIYNITSLINGYFRTPKYTVLLNLINWYNEYSTRDTAKNIFSQIQAKNLDTSSILENSWLAGLLDADSNFLITYSLNKENIAYNVDLTMRLSQQEKSVYGGNYQDVMEKIASALHTKAKLNIRNRRNGIEHFFLIVVKSRLSIKLLNDYLEIYPLLSSKRNDFESWKCAFYCTRELKYKDKEGTLLLKSLKGGMNSKRTLFNFDHLKEV